MTLTANDGERLTRLETHMADQNGDIAEIKTDLKSLRTWTVSTLVTLLIGVAVVLGSALVH